MTKPGIRRQIHNTTHQRIQIFGLLAGILLVLHGSSLLTAQLPQTRLLSLELSQHPSHLKPYKRLHHTVWHPILAGAFPETEQAPGASGPFQELVKDSGGDTLTAPVAGAQGKDNVEMERQTHIELQAHVPAALVKLRC
ncbi:MAG: hypothetical protein FRX49_02910 [Trebouxia sp. A1-2]|nr:MAG: hypothetical protein FRX49_02910 [Trebouxia sp. A1-2]